MSVFVFLGSSLSAERAREVLDVNYLPPAQQGDIVRLLPEKPRVIGLIDGLFGSVPAVWHKEILAALEQGCHVFGASSMGALRAAELHPFGMRGVGQIFAAYRDGLLEDDDEVAVSHAQADYGFRSLSVAMVNLRDRIEAGIAEQVVTEDEAEKLLSYAKSLYYPDRSFECLCVAARGWGWSDARVRGLQAFLKAPVPLLKERDAVSMLEQIRELLQSDPLPFRAEHKLSRTVFWDDLRRDVAARQVPTHTFRDNASVASTGMPLHALRKEALLQVLATSASESLGVEVNDGEIATARREFERGAGFADAAAKERWLSSIGMSARRLDGMLANIIEAKKVELTLAQRVDMQLPELVSLLTALSRNTREIRK